MAAQSVTSLLKYNIMNILKTQKTQMSILEIKTNLEEMQITDYRQGHLAGALKQILDEPGYISPLRGRYQYIGNEETEQKPETKSMAYQLVFLYEETVKKAAGILNHIDIVNSSEAEIEQLMRLRSIIVKTKDLISQMQECDI